MDDLDKIKFLNKGLTISRIPDRYRELFKNFSTEEFCGDYGMALRELLIGFFEYQQLKQMFLNNELDVGLIIGNKDNVSDKITEPEITNLKGEVMFNAKKEVKNE